MEHSDSPYVFRDEQPTDDADTDDDDFADREVVIVEGQAMSFRSYRRV